MKSNNQTIKNHLQYWRASLADASKISPTDNDIEQSFTITDLNLANGVLPPADTDKIWQGIDKDKDLIQVCIVTHLAITIFEHGLQYSNRSRKSWPLVIVYAMTDRTGNLSVTEECGFPYVPRNFVSPTNEAISVIGMDELDAFYTDQAKAIENWSDMLNLAKKLSSVIDSELDKQQFSIKPGGQVILNNASVPAKDIIKLYDNFINLGIPENTALNALFEEPIISPAPNQFDFRLNKLHVGQMGGEYGLSNSQRQSLLAFLECNGKILGINGAPGTGKTTLLQSVVASVWTRAAYDDGDCPIIVGSSTNNQAVSNIIDAFSKADINKADPIAVKLGGRWLPDISSFGMFMPGQNAGRKAKESGKKIQLYTDSKDKKATHFAVGFEDKTFWEDAVKHYTNQFTTHIETLDVHEKSPEEELSAARAKLHQNISDELNAMRKSIDAAEILANGGDCISLDNAERLASEHARKEFNLLRASEAAADKLTALKAIIINFLRHRESEPLLVLILAAIGLRGKRIARDRIFLIEESARTGIIELENIAMPNEDAIRGVINPLSKNIEFEIKNNNAAARTARERATTIYRSIDRWKSESLPDECKLEQFYELMDKSYRHRAFLMSVHYWEARFLLKTLDLINEKIVENKSPENLTNHFRRLAMLCPCFVSTMHKLPSWFTGYKGKNMPLEGKIDLLIIDEAGQVVPEISAASFALAKRVIAVGDTWQIEPIWGIPPSLDAANAKKFGIANHEEDYAKLIQSGKAAASGSIMKMAQRASYYEDGISLLEHRRCLKPIIEYCNQLVYKGMLHPLTDETDRPKMRTIPVMGYAHIIGRDQKKNGSRCNEVEAEVIARWLKSRRQEILDTYNVSGLGNNNDGKHEIVGIVTPFAAQVAELNRQLKAVGLDTDKITVGTVHSLQGAERELIIFSPVYDRPSKMFFDQSPNMLNVAVSRARNHFLVFGNMEVLSENPSAPSGLLSQMVKESSENEICDIFPVLPKSVNPQTVQLLCDLQSHRDCLLNTIRQSRSKVVLVSPYITESALRDDDICNEINRATRRNINVTVLIDEASNKKRDNEELIRCVDALAKTGARILSISSKANGYEKLHSKLLWADDDIFITGSFNWLSSPRYESGSKMEHSSVIRGASECQQLIKYAQESLNTLSGELMFLPVE